jgi:hypothetical protein
MLAIVVRYAATPEAEPELVVAIAAAAAWTLTSLMMRWRGTVEGSGMPVKTGKRAG